MELIQMLREMSIIALLSMLVSVFPLGAGIAYVMRPTERQLALMRPVSLAGLFAALCGTMAGFINVLRGIWMSEAAVNWKVVSVGAAESLTTLFVAFGCLTVAWLCVAIGFRRQP
jgi:hypothetical protein